MSKSKKRSRDDKVQITKRRLFVGLSLHIAVILALNFNIGESFYPAWLVAYQAQIVGILLFILLLLILFSPVMIEFSRNPQRLSGPGEAPWHE
jgi:hypothetical protein